MAPRLLELYRKEVIPKLSKEFGYRNVHQVPKLTKIVVNIGLGEATANPKLLEKAAEELAADHRAEAGDPQGAQVDRELQAARGAVGGLHGHAARATGCGSSSTGWSTSRCRACATSRASRTRPSTAAATSRSGIREQIIFPEIEFDKVERVTGMNVTVCTTARNDAEGRALLAHLGVPFRQ